MNKNYMIKVRFDIRESELTNWEYENVRWELVSEKTVKITNIPIYVDWISYGDEVYIKWDWVIYEFDKLKEKSENLTIRVYFFDEDNYLDIITELNSMWAFYESTWKLYVFNIPKEQKVNIINYLDKMEEKWRLEYEIADWTLYS